MNCYICEHKPGPGGTHYHVRPAVGICHHCGVGICLEHSHKTNKPGAPLLCPSCAALPQEKIAQPAHIETIHQN